MSLHARRGMHRVYLRHDKLEVEEKEMNPTKIGFKQCSSDLNMKQPKSKVVQNNQNKEIFLAKWTLNKGSHISCRAGPQTGEGVGSRGWC